MRKFTPILVILFALFSMAAFAGEKNEVLRGLRFATADIDNSETLTPDEFRTFIDLLADAGNKMAIKIRRFHLYDVAWYRVDANGDGLATYNELRSTQIKFNSKQPG